MKLKEISDSQRVLSKEAKAWLKKYMTVTGGSLNGWIQMWQNENAGYIAGSNVKFTGDGNVLDIPIEIEEVMSLVVSGFKIDDYTKLPKVRSDLHVNRCEVDSGILQYLDEKVESADFYDTKMSMEDVLNLISMRGDYSYYYQLEDSDYINLIRLATGKYLLDFSSGGQITNKRFEDVFDLQEFMLELPGIGEYFK